MKLEPLQCKYKKLIELHDVLYVPDIFDTLYSIIEHGSQPSWSFVINNGATAIEFPTFTLLAKTNAEINLDADLPFKDQQSHPEYTNLPNDFNNTTVRLIHERAEIPTRFTKEFAAYDLHSVEQVSIKPSKTKKLAPEWTSTPLKDPLVF